MSRRDQPTGPARDTIGTVTYTTPTGTAVGDPGLGLFDVLGRAPRDPGRVALVHEDRRLTFGDLAALGADVGEVVRRHRLERRVVGVPAERGPAFVARLLGLWGAGAVPAILGDWGRERVRGALAATGAAAVFAPSSAPAAGLEPLDVSGNGGGHVGDDVSHVLFTSGTTGRPKGIVVGRAAFAAACAAFFEELPMDEADRVAFLSRPGHDPSLRELIAPWVTGATLFVPGPRTAADPRPAADWLAAHSITVLQGSPVLLQLMAGASPRPVPSLRVVCSVGARLTAAALRVTARFAPRATVVNCYGASETPQVVCMYRVPPGQGVSGEDPVPIGRALGHATIRIVPEPGVSGGANLEGRLQVESSACALGYTGGAALLTTDQDGRRWYDTGDVVRLLPDGDLCFLRRADRQVQVNGTRVELDEIEGAATLVPGVAGSVATFVEDGAGVGTVRLTVVRTPGAAVDGEEIRAVLRDRLDPAVLPSSIEVRDSPQDSGPDSGPDSGRNGARDGGLGGDQADAWGDEPAEDQAGKLWAVLDESARSVLGRTGIDPDGGFFETGFTSMSLMRFVSEVSIRLGREISPVLVFRYPTLRAFADHLRETLDDDLA
ncbi:AMP-binding protein [Nonomuraea fuscirosea]|uniref:AMP-binding protein n=1 Tax=Nonomuraea fuscirosea TaxID=1291556 RepID=UPI003712C1A0